MSSSSLSAMSIKPFQLVGSLVSNDIVPNSQHFTPSTSRKRPASLLQRIDLSKCSKKFLGGSNESLNGINISRSGADEQSPDNEDCPIVSDNVIKLEEREESLKRLRLHSQCSISASEGTNLLSTTEWQGSHEQLLFTDSTKVNNHSKIQQNLSELEGNQWSSESTSPQNVQLSSCGLVLEDEFRGSKFELVGDGRNCKAVETNDQNNAVWNCQCFKLEEFCQISEIMARMQGVATDYGEEEFSMISNMLLPIEQLRIIRSPQRRGLVYMLLPDHHGNLHQLLEENELSCLNGGPARLSEERAQPILKQMALLLDFCHRIGLYFRDFRLRKFVFTDSEKTQIRVNNVLDLYLAPKGTNISVISREFIPAYIAPELIDKKNEQCGGKASDIWAFGILIFTLLNGRYPFFESSRSPITLLRRIRAHRFSFPIHESISEPARWLIHSLLSPKPEDRPTAKQILHAHWFRFNRNSFAYKTEYADPKRQNDILEQSKATLPPSTFFLFSSPGRMDSLSPVGQVPSQRRLSPITTALESQLVNNNINELGILRHGLMTRPTLLQQRITTFDSQTAISQRTTLLENRQQHAEHSEIGGHRRGQPPAFVPINYAGPLTFSRGVGDGRQIIANHRELMMHLIPTNLTINNIGTIPQADEIFRKKQNENKDRIVPDRK